MSGETRRNEILTIIANSEKPISASSLAQKYKVSRQIIVGDVALLRATGHDITATARGYVMYTESTDRFVGKIAVSHSLSNTEVELKALLDLNIYIQDVTVEHPIYGEITGQLNIRNQSDLETFIYNITHKKAELLSSLTQGVHLHTISCPDKKTYLKAQEVLKEQGFLIINN